jgi:hypothetical protein
MNVITPHKTQYCPDQTHDGVWTDGGKTKTPRTRALWPLQFFDRAVTQYNDENNVEAIAALPDLDFVL